MSQMHAVRRFLSAIYGEQGTSAFARIADLLARASKQPARRTERFSQKDAVLITYGDSLIREGQAPLQTLYEFSATYLKGAFSAIHLLPIFPYSSDDGFSVTDFFGVNPSLGDWTDVRRLGDDFELMFDFVLNHVSAQSDWFRHYLKERPGFSDLAMEVDPSTDLSMVTRPRALALLTPFEKADGQKVHVWTTFSADQVDLNYRSIDVLCRMIEVLLHYVDNGARLIRMDAVAYLWKQLGTSCIHLRQTHLMVRLLRAILNQVAPDVLIVTETNVPHAENVSYFGNGWDEAQMVYNFSLPPLLLHTFTTCNASALSAWADGLSTPSDGVTFFNFTASHDGIGVRPLEGILPAEHIRLLARAAERNGGQVSVKQNPDGSQSPYELNVTYVDALARPDDAGSARHADRFLAAQAIQLALPGVPGVYIHSLLGSRNWSAGVAQTGRARTINREKPALDDIVPALTDPNGFRARIFHRYLHLLRVRGAQSAFHPLAASRVLFANNSVFGLERRSATQTVYALTHVGGAPVDLSLQSWGAPPRLKDLLSGHVTESGRIGLRPYDILWLTADQ
ncbi:MAG: sugar phosphorylase [Desulfatitalea sp.]|nr:sugar phosphorylase [Desulfatitalea sp.]